MLRLCRCQLELHHGTVLGTLSLLLSQNPVGHLMFITERYTPRREPFMRAYWADFLEKWGNQSKKQLCKEKSLIQGLAPRLSTLLKTVRVQVLRTTIFFLLLFDTLRHKTTIYILREDDNLILGYSL